MNIMESQSIIPYLGHSPKWGEGVFVASGAKVIGQVSIGDYSNIWFNTVVRGDDHFIEIGKNTNIQDNSVVHITKDRYPTIIGDGVTIGHSATIHACTVKSSCLIGMGATILDGAVIPRHSIVGAGALVSPGKTFEEGYLILGAPAKPVRKLTSEEIQGIEESAEHYIDLASSYKPTE